MRCFITIISLIVKVFYVSLPPPRESSLIHADASRVKSSHSFLKSKRILFLLFFVLQVFIGVFSSRAQTCPPGYQFRHLCKNIIVNGSPCYVCVHTCVRQVGNVVDIIFMGAEFHQGCATGANLADASILNQLNDMVLTIAADEWGQNPFVNIPYCASQAVSYFEVNVSQVSCYRKASDGSNVLISACPTNEGNFVCKATYKICRNEQLQIQKTLVSKDPPPANACPAAPDWIVPTGPFQSPCMPYCF